MSNRSPQDVHEQLRSFATETLGSDLKITDRSRKFGRRSITWRLTAKGRAAYYLKKHEVRRHYEAEEIAYRTWVPELERSGKWHSPELVASSSELGALILTEAPGEVLDDSEIGLDDRLEMHRIAGWLAAQIHSLDVDASEAGPPRLYAQKMLGDHIELASSYFELETLQWLEKVAAIDNLFDSLEVVPTHSDYSPRNWLIHRRDGVISLGIIDWERARPGYWLEDAQRMAFDHWSENPQLRTAYFDGYGRVPNPVEERQLKLICLANAIGTVSWATEHGDTAFAQFGRRTLMLLKHSLSNLVDI